MYLSWMQVCAIVQAFAIAQNCHVSINDERQQILLYRDGRVVFQLPRLVISPARLNQGAWTIHVVQGYILPRLAFTPAYSELRFNQTLLEAWAVEVDGHDEL
jgi:hypothetical protein